MALSTCGDREFVQAYVAAKSTDELALKLGLSKGTVLARAKKLRAIGVLLPKYQRASYLIAKREVDVAGLNQLIASSVAPTAPIA
jgi:biotin operon repressor